MINQTFKPFSNVGPTTEKKLRAGGIDTWEDLLAQKNKLSLSAKKRKKLCEEVERFIEAKTNNDLNFFSKHFPIEEKWRILAQYFPKASYLDIETTGLDRKNSIITVIVCFHRGNLRTFIQGENLEDFIPLIEELELLVTFNGASFDIPVIEKYFKLPPIECAHIDLRWVSYHLGFQGGLKEIEKKLGLHRPEDLEGVDGFEAVMLWYKWQETKNTKAKDKLIKYCQADVLSLILVTGALLNKKNIPVRVGREIYKQHLS